MSRPLSLDDDEFDEEPRDPRLKSPASDEEGEDPVPRQLRDRRGERMMPAGSPVAVGLVLILAMGLVGTAIASVGMLLALRPLKKSGTDLVPAGASGNPADPDPRSSADDGKKPADTTKPPTVPKKLPRGAVPLSVSPELVTRTVFAGGETGHCAIVTSKPRGPGRMINVFKTQTGEAIGRVSVDTSNDLGYALSPDGRTLAILGAAPKGDGSPIALHSVETGAVLTRIVPYQKAGGLSGPDLVWAAILSKGSLLTLGSNGSVDLWSAGTMQRTHSLPSSLPTDKRLEVDSATHCPKNFAISADGTTLASFDGTRFLFHSTVDLQLLSVSEPIASPDSSIVFSGAALNGSGSRFACYYQAFGASGTVAVGVWNPTTGKRIASPSLRAVVPPAGFAWWGDEHLLFWKSGFSSADLFNLKSMRTAGSLHTSFPNRFCTVPAGNQVWAIMGGEESKRALLVQEIVPTTLVNDARLEFNATGLLVR